MSAIRTLSIVAGLATCLAIPVGVRADATLKEAEHAVTEIVAADAGQQKFLDGAAGYAVFPNVAKGGLVVGGAGGSGFLFVGGKAVGTTTLSQVTVGAQVGGQAYYEIVYFETAETLAAFKKGEWTMAAQVSAVALASGASANAKYKEGVAVFTLTKGGAMAEASIGGQKFSYKPIAVKG
jgi:lipid-binding SYLF domain-containing protein